MPVVVVSADVAEGLARQLRAAGAIEVLGKPLQLDGLLTVVDVHHRGSRAR